MTNFRTHKGPPLDGTVGTLSELDQSAAPATAGNSRIQVFVSGDGVSDPGAIGLDEDLRLTIQGFIQRSRSGDRETAPDTPASDADGNIEIALHGLNLSPEEERELHHLLRELVRKRVAGEGATK
jgi:hypothetical protein